MGVLTILPLFIGFGLFLYSLDVHSYLYLPLPILGFLGLVLAVFYYWKLRLDNRDGVLNEAGAEVYYLWTSFENMLREIARLDQAELESIVVWNRLLVYATLFGYADKVSHLMKVHHIQVENPDINLYVAYGWHGMFYHSSAQMSHYASVANTASTYPYLLEVEVLAVASPEVEAVAVSVLFKENCHRLKKICYNGR